MEEKSGPELEIPEGIEVLDELGRTEDEREREAELAAQQAGEAAEAEAVEAATAGLDEEPDAEPPSIDLDPPDPDAEDIQALEADIAADEAAAQAPAAEAPSEEPTPAQVADWDLAVLYDEILVEQLAAPDTKRVGGVDIQLADTYKDRHRPLEALVLLVGEGFPRPDGSLRPMKVRVGDRVHYGPHAGHDIEIDGRELRILKEDEVLAAWRLREPCGCSGWTGCQGHEPASPVQTIEDVLHEGRPKPPSEDLTDYL